MRPIAFTVTRSPPRSEEIDAMPKGFHMHDLARSCLLRDRTGHAHHKATAEIQDDANTRRDQALNLTEMVTHPYSQTLPNRKANQIALCHVA
jgi:hypothetical protein